jgi:peptidoglycan LD-endopeptidase LytH
MASFDGRVTYVADDFPPGTQDVFVRQGTLLGYQGEYNGTGVPIATHLHFSIVTSEDDGSFKNEAVLSNTLDPSPYFGLPLNFSDRPSHPISCD